KTLRVADGYSGPLLLTPGQARFGSRRVPVTDRGEMLINFTNGKVHTCPYLVALSAAGCPAAVVTGKIVVVGIKMLSADDLYTQARAFKHDATFCPPSRPACMQDSQNYGYRIMGDELTTVLQQKYLRAQPPLSVGLAAAALAVATGVLGYVLRPRRAVLALLVALALYAAVVLALRGAYLTDSLFPPLA